MEHLASSVRELEDKGKYVHQRQQQLDRYILHD